MERDKRLFEAPIQRGQVCKSRWEASFDEVLNILFNEHYEVF
jgi:hypothetical protein